MALRQLRRQEEVDPLDVGSKRTSLMGALTDLERDLMAKARSDRCKSEQECEEEVAAAIEAAFLSACVSVAPRCVEDWMDRSPLMALRSRRWRRGFERRIERDFGQPFDEIEMLLECCRELSEAFWHRNLSGAIDKDDYRFEAMSRIDSRATLVGSEMLALLRVGHGHGALARWRTLHELSTVQILLGTTDSQLGRRYLEHAFVERYNDMTLEGVLDTDQEYVEVRAARDEILSRYEAGFGKAWAWARPLFPNRDPKARLGFHDLAQLANEAEHRSSYRLASHLNHAGSTGAEMLMTSFREHELMLAGPSNGYLFEPARQLLRSRLLVVHAYLTGARGEIDEPMDLVALYGLNEFAKQIDERLILAHEGVHRAEEELGNVSESSSMGQRRFDARQAQRWLAFAQTRCVAHHRHAASALARTWGKARTTSSEK